MCNSDAFEGSRLPPEADLSKQLKVSIGTVRKALTFLETEGYIVKRQGSGNYILRSAVNPKMRVDIAYDMGSLLQSGGFQQVERTLERCHVEQNNPSFLTPLLLTAGEACLVCEFVYEADETPAIFTRYYVPVKLIRRALPRGLKLDDFDAFLWDYCELEPLHSITTWNAQIPDAVIQQHFNISDREPIIRWEQIVYDVHDSAVIGAEAFFHPRLMALRSLFRWNFQPRK